MIGDCKGMTNKQINKMSKNKYYEILAEIHISENNIENTRALLAGDESVRVYNSAPLPFMGQKRRFVRDFREMLKRFDDVTTIVDLFGGSGLLAHVAKRERPEARVIYNDYDYFCKRIEHVVTTNRILA